MVFLFYGCSIFSYLSEVTLILFLLFGCSASERCSFPIALLFIVGGIYLTLSILPDDPWWSMHKRGLLRAVGSLVVLMAHSLHYMMERLVHILRRVCGQCLRCSSPADEVSQKRHFQSSS